MGWQNSGSSIRDELPFFESSAMCSQYTRAAVLRRRGGGEDSQDKDQGQPRLFKYLSAARMLCWKTGYAISSMPIAGHCAPWPVKTQARRGSDLALVGVGMSLSPCLRAAGESAMAKARHAWCVLLEAKVWLKSLRKRASSASSTLYAGLVDRYPSYESRTREIPSWSYADSTSNCVGLRSAPKSMPLSTRLCLPFTWSVF